MSLYDYNVSREIESKGYPFYALLMAAIRQADSDNLVKLRDAFPEVFRELNLRYNAGGGILVGVPGKIKGEQSDTES